MSETPLPVSSHTVTLPREDLRKMLKLVRTLEGLSSTPRYQQAVYAMAPEIVRYDPGHSAVMMGYDFHITADGPKLIEVNTNAGGSFLALQTTADEHDRERLRKRTLKSFLDDFRLYSHNSKTAPYGLLILDEQPQEQFLYPEMNGFAALFNSQQIKAQIADPLEVSSEAGELVCHGRSIDMIYNRHCDFYLDTPPMQTIRDAYLEGTVCLSPNPRIYGLLADKRRMTLWHDRQLLDDCGLSAGEIELLGEVVPETRLLETFDLENLWQERKQWVFKPATQFGSRGVLLGPKTTHKRFNQLDPQTTLCQRLAEPQMVSYPDGSSFKADLRLFVYRKHLLGLTARLYRGQVTNMRTEGGGFAHVQVI